MNDRRSSPAPTTFEATFRALIRTFGVLKRFMDPYFALHGVSGSQWGVLWILMRAEREGRGGLRLTDLGERLLVRPPSMTGVVDRLQRMGLVVRTPSPTDLRTKYVSLTDAGRKLVRDSREGHAAQIKTFLEALSDEEQRDLQAKLSRIGDHVDALIAGGAAPRGKAPAEQGEGEG